MSWPPMPLGRELEMYSRQLSKLSATGMSSALLLTLGTGTPVPNDSLLLPRVETPERAGMTRSTGRAVIRARYALQAAGQLVAMRGDGVAHAVAQALAGVLVLPAQQLAPHPRIPEPPEVAGDAFERDGAIRLGLEERGDAVGHLDQLVRIHAITTWAAGCSAARRTHRSRAATRRGRRPWRAGPR